MRAILAILILATGPGFGGAALADYQDGLKAAQSGDYETAYREFLLLAEQGDALAQSLIGAMYHEGIGIPQNDKEAVKWYRKAAEQGIASAQHDLGAMYAKGEGVPVNNVKAYMWWSLAKAQGHENAAFYLDIVKKGMTATQIAKAQELAAEWLEKHN